MAQYFFDPNEWEVGDGLATPGFPFDIIAGTFATVSIVLDGGGAKCLLAGGDDAGGNRKILAFTLPGLSSTTELYAHIATGGNFSSRLGVRAKNSGSVDHYQWRPNALDEIVNTALTNIATTTGQGDTGKLRFRAVGASPTVVEVKFWLAGDSEPVDFDMSVSSSTAALQVDGYAALTPFRNNISCYGFGVGTDGDPAPTGPFGTTEAFALRHNPRTNKVIPVLSSPTVTDIGANCVRPRVTKGF